MLEKIIDSTKDGELEDKQKDVKIVRSVSRSRGGSSDRMRTYAEVVRRQ